MVYVVVGGVLIGVVLATCLLAAAGEFDQPSETLVPASEQIQEARDQATAAQTALDAELERVTVIQGALSSCVTALTKLTRSAKLLALANTVLVGRDGADAKELLARSTRRLDRAEQDVLACQEGVDRT
jgi:hypothetical protein